MDLISQLANPSNALITLFYCLKFFPPIDRSTPVEWWLQQAAAMWWGLLSSNCIGRLGRIENIKRPSIGKVALKVIFIKKTAKIRNNCVLPSLLLLLLLRLVCWKGYNLVEHEYMNNPSVSSFWYFHFFISGKGTHAPVFSKRLPDITSSQKISFLNQFPNNIYVNSAMKEGG